MAAFTRESRDGAYYCGVTFQPLSICANSEKKVPREWIDEAFLAGKSAVEYAISGGTGKMAAFTRESKGGSYHCGVTFQPLSICANSEKKVPREWIDEAGTNVTQEFIDYVLPLIQGENDRKTENGLPRFARLKKIKAEV